MRSVVFACLWIAASGIVQADDEAQEIAGKMLARYESLRSYRDSSTLEHRLAGIPLRGSATTHYIAPDTVLVTGQAGTGRRVFAAEGGQWRSWSPDEGWESETPELWFSGLTGVSVWLSDAPVRVLSIFFPDESYRNPLRKSLREARKRPDQRIDRVDCYSIEVTGAKRTLVLWIGKDDLLIRRIEEIDETGTRVTRIKPEADPAITPEGLRQQTERLTHR